MANRGKEIKLSGQTKVARAVALAALCCVLLHGCQSIPREYGAPVKDESLAANLRRVVEEMYPQHFRSVHRVILSARGRQFDLNGYVLVSRPSEVRFIASGDLGGTAFELLRNADGEVTLLRNSAGLRRSWLTDGAARDAALIYLTTPAPESKLVRYDGNSLGLIEEHPDGTVEEFRFDASGRRLTGYDRWERAKRIYKAEFFYEGSSPRWRGSAPSVIKITNHRLNYRLMIRVLELEALQEDGSRS